MVHAHAMPRSRQDANDRRDRASLDRRATFETHARDYGKSEVIAPHAHDRAQLIFAKSGVMRVTSEGGAWVVPPERAVWMPAGQPHAIRCASAVAMRTLYLDPGALADPVGDACRVLGVTPLLREIMVALCERALLPARAALLEVLLAELRTLDTLPLHLPEPASAPLRRLAGRLDAAPADARPAAAWAREAGLSQRTLLRRWQAETGMAFGRWRRQARLLVAIEQLAEGLPVTAVALDAGYESPSAFTATFRRALGVVPSRYFA